MAAIKDWNKPFICKGEVLELVRALGGDTCISILKVLRNEQRRGRICYLAKDPYLFTKLTCEHLSCVWINYSLVPHINFFP